MTTAKSKYPDLVIGVIMISTLMGAALVSPLYPLYRTSWSLSTSEIMQLYVGYMGGAVVSLMVLGRLADRLGYRKVMGGAIVLCLFGTIGSFYATDFASFACARFIVGVASSLITTSGTVALVTVTPEKRRGSLALICSLVIAVGFAIGPFIGGAFGQWSSAPLTHVHIPSLILVTLSLLALLFLLPPLDRPKVKLSRADFMPKLSWSPPEHSLRFGLSCCLPFITFSVFGLYASMAPMLIRNFTGYEGPIISGAYIGLFLLVSAFFQMAARKLPTRVTALTSLVLLAAGNLCMLANISLGSIWLFAIGVSIASIAHGMSMLASASVVMQVSRVEDRSALTSTYWAIGYSGSIFPMLLVGWFADHYGMERAVAFFCATMAAASVFVFVLIVALAGRLSPVKR